MPPVRSRGSSILPVRCQVRARCTPVLANDFATEAAKRVPCGSQHLLPKLGRLADGETEDGLSALIPDNLSQA